METSFRPEIVVLYCGRVLSEGSYLPEGAKRLPASSARFVMVPCSGKIWPQYLVKIIEGGADGILVIGCPAEECQFITGSTRAEAVVRFARTLLDEIGMGGSRIEITHAQGLTADQVIALAEKCAASIAKLGPNPLKPLPAAA